MMRLMTAAALCLSATAAPALAQQMMSGDEIKAYISGKVIEFSDGWATYKADGGYEYYIRANGTKVLGQWSIQGNRACIDFNTGGSRCDQYLKDAGKIALKNSRGTSYPVLSVK